MQSVVGRSFDRLSEEIDALRRASSRSSWATRCSRCSASRSPTRTMPERAVRAALEMQAVLSELNRGFAAEGKPQLAMRIGIEAGEVLVDLERAAGPRDRMLTGDAVNTAARLQAAADPGHVVVGPGVYAATKDVIDFQELAPLTLKGKAEPVPAWDALRVKREAARRASIARARGQADRTRRGADGPEADPAPGRGRRPSCARDDRRPGGRRQVAARRSSPSTWKGLPEFVYWRRGRCLAYGNTAVLRAGRRDQGAVRDTARTTPAEVVAREGRRRRPGTVR